jgi:hypothetical protein
MRVDKDSGERRTLYLSRTKDFNPWTVSVPGAKVVFYDPSGFSAELTVEAGYDAFLQVAEELSERLDLDGWQLLDAASAACWRCGPSRDLLLDPRYRRELENLLIHGQDWPFGPEYDCEECTNGDFVFRWGQVVLHSRGDELLGAVLEPSGERAKASHLSQVDELEDRLSNERSRRNRVPRQRHSDLAERALVAAG